MKNVSKKLFVLYLFVWFKHLVTKQKLRTKFVTRRCNFVMWLYLYCILKAWSCTKKHMKHVHYFKINRNNFEKSDFSEYSQLLLPAGVVPKVLPKCYCKGKLLWQSPIVITDIRFRLECFPVNLHHRTREQLLLRFFQ